MYWAKKLAWWNLMLNSSLNKALILFLKCKHGTHFLPYISVAIVGYWISTVQDPKVGFSWLGSGLLHLHIKNETLWLSLQSSPKQQDAPWMVHWIPLGNSRLSENSFFLFPDITMCSTQKGWRWYWNLLGFYPYLVGMHKDLFLWRKKNWIPVPSPELESQS